MERKSIHSLFIHLLLVLIITACAVVGQPSGGEKDVEPPVALSAYPADRSANFSANKVEINFNEFIKLNKINQTAIFSPPLEHAVEYSMKGKSLIVEFEDTLKENTTYTIYFGNAIGDNNENNILKNFQYVFSTGSYVDSMQIKGFVKDAFSIEAPEEAVFVMLYRSFNDSLPLKQKPFYISKTDESGYFEINNIANASYKIFVLKDMNSNLLYDQPNEYIAFLNEALSAEIPYISKKRDSLDYAADTSLTEADSIYYIPNNIFHDLYLFDEVDSTQRLEEYPRVNDKMLKLIFRFPVDSFEMRFINNDIGEWCSKEWNSLKDTLSIWLTKEIYPDTLLLEIKTEANIIDTARLLLNIDNKSSIGRGAEELTELEYNSTVKRTKKLPYFKNYTISFSQPLKSIEGDFVLYTEEDTLIPDIRFLDSLYRKIEIMYDWEQGKQYELIIPDSIIFDIYGFTTDSIQEKFKVTKEEDYASVILKLQAEQKSYILQLIDVNQEVKAEQYISGSGTYTFENVLPASYGFKLIEDTNDNKRWDTGDYIKGRLPEKVIIYPENIDLKANWDHELEWIF